MMGFMMITIQGECRASVMGLQIPDVQELHEHPVLRGGARDAAAAPRARLERGHPRRDPRPRLQPLQGQSHLHKTTLSTPFNHN